MKRLLLLLCLLLAAQQVCARPPAVRFDLPYTLENGYYIVVLGTPAGPRRFLFDTGATTTCIGESLCAELKTASAKTIETRDYEGHTARLRQVRLDSLRMGELLLRDLPVVVIPDSSALFCFPIDGIAGCDLLRNLVVRMPNADGTITITDDAQTLGEDFRRPTRMAMSNGRPLLPVTLRKGEKRATAYALLDTGFGGFFDLPVRDDRTAALAEIADSLRWSEGYASGMGWTNRKVRNLQFRGTIPAFEIAGATIADMPIRRTFGGTRKLGSRLFDFGRIVLDFRRKRFLFLPEAGELRAASLPVLNIVPTFSGGRLVVGQVWDETLADIVSPGDRIRSFDGVPWAGDLCDFYTAFTLKLGMTCEIETASGARVFVTIQKL